MTLSASQRETVFRLLARGVSQAKAAEAAGCSTASVKRLKKHADETGEEAQAPKPRGRTMPKLSQEVLDHEVKDFLEKNPKASVVMTMHATSTCGLK